VVSCRITAWPTPKVPSIAPTAFSFGTASKRWNFTRPRSGGRAVFKIESETVAVVATLSVDGAEFGGSPINPPEHLFQSELLGALYE